MAKPISVHYEIKGPLFDRLRHGGEVLEEANREWVTDLTREGEAKVEAQLYQGHGVRTGAYKATIHSAIRDSRHGIIATSPDRRTAIIGNWLEGSRSRNESHRFKGYGMWRKTRAHIRRLANELAGKVYARATKRLT